MLSEASVPLIHLLRKARKVEQHSEGTEPERNEAPLGDTKGEHRQEGDRQCKRLG
jgi:hypothetical protein